MSRLAALAVPVTVAAALLSPGAPAMASGGNPSPAGPLASSAVSIYSIVDAGFSWTNPPAGGHEFISSRSPAQNIHFSGSNGVYRLSTSTGDCLRATSGGYLKRINGSCTRSDRAALFVLVHPDPGKNRYLIESGKYGTLTGVWVNCGCTTIKLHSPVNNFAPGWELF